jgi:hypothetical protein
MGSTQPLTGMSTRDISQGVKVASVGLTALPPSCADCLDILEASTTFSSNGLSRPAMGYLYLFVYLLNAHKMYNTRNPKMLTALNRLKTIHTQCDLH